MTPYNTGRVQIGRCYFNPKNRIEGDAVTIQSALLAKPSSRPPLWLWSLVYSACATVVFIVVVVQV